MTCDLNLTSVFIFYIAFLLRPCIETATFSDATNLHTTLTNGYNKNVRPKTNQSETTTIHVAFELKSITSLDEVNGILTTVGIMNALWIDENLQWDPSNHGNIEHIKLDENLIWIPDFVTANPANKMEKLGLPSVEVDVKYTGNVHQHLAEMLRTTCDADVTYFPFDTQNCVLELTPFGYKSHEVTLVAMPVVLMFFEENNEWILKSTSSVSAMFATQPYIKITLTLERRYVFFLLNLFSPVLILVFLNTLVFILPAESGERIGFAITCLLSLSVYMTFASENLPTSSKPIALFIYVLLLYMVISSLICVVTIIGMKFHLHDADNSPSKFICKLLCFKTSRMKCRKVKVEEVKEPEKIENIKTEKEEDITWKTIAKRFDKICLVFSVFSILIVSTMSMGIVLSRR